MFAFLSSSRSIFYGVFVLSVLIALASYRFVFLGLSDSFPGMAGHIDHSLLAFVLHISLAPIALILAVVQFVPKIRIEKTSRYHRWVGRTYGVCVLLAGLAGLWVALDVEGGPIASVGFAMLSCVWVYVTAKGVYYARAKQFSEHRRWMLRSFALTLAGVTLRLQLLGFALAGVEYPLASVFLAWTCWVPNLIVVNWWLRQQEHRGKTSLINAVPNSNGN